MIDRIRNPECELCGLSRSNYPTYNKPLFSHRASVMVFTFQANNRAWKKVVDRVIELEKQHEVYLTSVVKCPRGNPNTHSVIQCAAYFHQEIEAIVPFTVYLVGEDTVSAFGHKGRKQFESCGIQMVPLKISEVKTCEFTVVRSKL